MWAYTVYILQEVPSPENAGVCNIQEIMYILEKLMHLKKLSTI